MGNCFVSKPKKEKPEEEGQDSSESQSKALNLFKQKQKIKEDTITEKANGTLLKEDKKQSNIIMENQVSDVLKMNKYKPIRQRNEKKNKKFLQGVVILEQNTENINKLEREKKPTDYQLILNALSQHYFFTNLSEKHKEDIVYKMFYCKVDSQQFVFKQGDQASSYYIIEKGQCEVLINDEHKRKIQAGQGFGELALLYGAPRSASIRALEETYLWGIDRSTFRKAVEELVQREFQENRTFIDSINFFDWMNSDQKDAIAGVIVTQQFKQDEPIVIEGDPATSYFIIKSGIVKIVKGGKEIRKMNEGDSFGEQALYQNSIRGASVIAESLEVKCLAIGREMITKILGDKIQVIMYNNLLKWSFEKNSLLCKLTKIQVEKIVSKIETVNYEAKQNVFASNSKCDKLVIVLEGALENGVKQIATKGQMVGDQFLAQKNRDKLIPYDIFMDKKGKVAQITFDQFYECIGGELEQVIEKNQNNHEIKYMNKQKSQYVYDYLTLEQMIMIKKLGFGQFGSVYLCRNTKDHKLYAIKCIVKNQIVEQHLENHLVMEKKVLESVQFPLIMKFFKSLRDENNIYFLVEYIRGMELFDVIRDIGLLNIMDSQFFIGSLLLCMEYLHSHHIIYRDIKPENIMVDHQGYMRLIDMGTAKYLKGKGRTFTIIGTPHYMAPEIITGKGYTYTVDIWSIGVCLFEFMCGGVPFAEDAEDPYDIYEEIVKKPLTFPAFLKDKKTRKFCDQLLNKTPEQRIGTGYPAVKAHPWFETLDWDKLMDRELKPPYIPPKDKIISDKEIQRLESEGKQLINEIKIEQGEKAIYIKDKAKDPLWDQKKKNVLYKTVDATKAATNRIRDRCRDFSEIKVSRHRYLAQIGEASVIDYKLPIDHNFDMFLRFKKRQTRNKGLSLKDSKIYDTLKMSKINQTLPNEVSNITQEKFNNYREINRKIQEQFERNQTIDIQKNQQLVPLIRQKMQLLKKQQVKLQDNQDRGEYPHKLGLQNDVPLKDSNITDLDEYNYSTLKDIQSLQAESYQRKVGKVSQQRHMDRMLRK